MDPAKMKVVELRAELSALGLDSKGNKAVLVDRLKNALDCDSSRAEPVTIIDTSTEDVEEEESAGRSRRQSAVRRSRPGPASRTRRRLSSAEPTTPGPSRSSRRDPDSTGTPAKPNADCEQLLKILDGGESGSDGESILSDSKAASPKPESKSSLEPIEEVKVTEVASDDEMELQSPIKVQPRDVLNEPVVLKEDQELIQESFPPNSTFSVSSPAQSFSPKEDVKESKMESIPEASSEPIPVIPVQSSQIQALETAPIEENKQDIMVEQVKVNPVDDTVTEEMEMANDEKVDAIPETTKVFEDVEMKDEEETKSDVLKHDLEKKDEKSRDEVPGEKKEQESGGRRDRDRRKRDKQSRWSNSHHVDEDEEDSRSYGRGSSASKRQRDSSPRRKSPSRCVEPEIPANKVSLSWYDSDLNLVIKGPDMNWGTPLTDGGFGYCWAGARASHGVSDGRVCYEIKLQELMTSSEGCTPSFRVGWSALISSLHLGEDKLSWGYCNSAQKANNSQFEEYGVELAQGDVIGVYLDLESTPCTMSYTVNGFSQGTAFEFEKSLLQDAALFPHVLSKNCIFIANFGHQEHTLLTKSDIIDKQYEAMVAAEAQSEKHDNLRRSGKVCGSKRFERKDDEKARSSSKEKSDYKKNDTPEDKNGDVEAKENGQNDKGGEKYDPMENTDDDEQDDDKAPAQQALLEVPNETTEASADAPKAEDVESPKEMSDEDTAKVEESVTSTHAASESISVEAAIEIKEVPMLEGYIFIGKLSFDTLMIGPQRPAPEEQCQVIMLCGLPGTGKTYWAMQHTAAHPEKRFNILGTSTLIDKMKVDCKPLKGQLESRWEMLVAKVPKCVVKLIELAHSRRRNYILDQTNVYPSAQRRKMREFVDYKRSAVVIVPDEATFAERQRLRAEKDGKDVPDGAVLEMKANFVLPEKCMWLDEVSFAELGEEDARRMLDKYNKEGQAAGYSNSGRDRGPPGQSGTPCKRSRFDSGGDRGRHGGPPERGRYGPPSRNSRNDSRRDERRGVWGGRHGGSGGWDSGRSWGHRDAPYRDNRPPRDGQGAPPYRGDRWGGGQRGGHSGGRDARGGAPMERRPPSREPPSAGERGGKPGQWIPRGAPRHGPTQQRTQRPQGPPNNKPPVHGGTGDNWGQQGGGWQQQGSWGGAQSGWQHQGWGQQAGWNNWGQWGSQGQGGAGAAQGNWQGQGGWNKFPHQQGQWGQWPAQHGYWGQQWPVQQGNTSGGSGNETGGQAQSQTQAQGQAAPAAQTQHQQEMWAQYARAYVQQGYTLVNNASNTNNSTEKK